MDSMPVGLIFLQICIPIGIVGIRMLRCVSHVITKITNFSKQLSKAIMHLHLSSDKHCLCRCVMRLGANFKHYVDNIA